MSHKEAMGPLCLCSFVKSQNTVMTPKPELLRTLEGNSDLMAQGLKARPSKPSNSTSSGARGRMAGGRGVGACERKMLRGKHLPADTVPCSQTPAKEISDVNTATAYGNPFPRGCLRTQNCRLSGPRQAYLHLRATRCPGHMVAWLPASPRCH